MTIHIQVASALIDIEAALRNLGYWESVPPPPRALASTEPFCIDTLALHQWLQFVFIPRMEALIEAEAGLPANCAIKPMAEEYYRDEDRDIGQLLAALAAVDELLGG